MSKMTQRKERFEACLARAPLIAILRGVLPGEVVEVAGELLARGIRMIEVPLNSPDACASLHKLVRTFGAQGFIGAGTVTRVDQVEQIAALGVEYMVAPNTDTEVIQAALRAELLCLPGVTTITEAYAALKAGAHALKIFPAEQVGLAAIGAWRSVLDADVRLVAVGGVNEQNIGRYFDAGFSAAGLGAGLFRPGLAAAAVGQRAAAYLAALEASHAPSA